MLLDGLDTFTDRVALLDPEGTMSRLSLLEGSAGLGEALCAPNVDRRGERIAILCRPGREFTSAILAVWWSGAIAVPLHPEHPVPELDHVVGDARCSVIVASPVHAELARQLATTHDLRLVLTDPTLRSEPPRRRPEAEDDALIVYTSGTTGRPKGVVHTHRSLEAQMTSMIEAWQWTAEDRTICVLPLHHVHGLVNVTLTALRCGAMCESPGGFDAVHVWNRLASGDLTVFMAVPTIYARLITAWEDAESDIRTRWSEGAGRLRLMVSGSAALPVSVLERWRELTGQVLLERYGMTEVGMALSNTLERRVPGHVGWPMPGVEIRLDDEGELLVRGPQVFDRYWRRPSETSAAFEDGWFRTGDVAKIAPNGHRLLGRASIDIIKTGGEKVSALEIEECFREHPAVAECAVVGVPDRTWGEAVAMAILPTIDADPASLEVDELRDWGRSRLSAPKLPRRVLVVEALPRNALGKVVKTEVAERFQPSGDGG